MHERCAITGLDHWKDVAEYEEFYAISCLGRVWSKRHHRHMKPARQWNGYEGIVFSVNKKLRRFTIHRLVAMAFCDRPDGAQTVDHLDNDKLHNRAANLQWVTLSENIRRGIARGTTPPPPRNDVRGAKNGAVKIDEVAARAILAPPYHRGLYKQLAKTHGICTAEVGYIRQGRRWAHLGLHDRNEKPNHHRPKPS